MTRNHEKWPKEKSKMQKEKNEKVKCTIMLMSFSAMPPVKKELVV
jgi:hypothetical protein